MASQKTGTSFLNKWFSLNAVPFWLYGMLALSYLYRDLPIYHGILGRDPDIYLRATQILEFLQNGHWFDTLNARMDPPGADVYWRLVDLPYALVAWLFKPLVDLRTAVTIAVTIVPPLLLLPLYIGLSVWAAEPFVGRRWSRLAPIPAIFVGTGILYFAPDQCDHHNIEILLLTALVGLFARAVKTNDRAIHKKLGLIFGLVAALSLSLVIEGLPFIGFFFCTAALCTLDSQNGKRAGFLLTAGWSFPLFIVLFLIATRNPATYFDRVLYHLSWLHVLIASAAGLLCFATCALSRWRIHYVIRLFVLAMLGVLCGLGLLLIEPDLLRGAWIGFDPFIPQFALAHTEELQTVIKPGNKMPMDSASLVFALFGYVFSFKYGNRTMRWMVAPMVLVCVIIALGENFYVLRLTRFMPVLLASGLLMAGKLANDELKKLPLGRKRAAFELLVLLLLGPLEGPMLHMIFANDRSLDSLFFYAPRFETKANILNIASYLNMQPASDHPRRILAGITNGPELTFRTPHIAIGTGQQYTHSAGYKVNLAFYGAKSSEVAAKVLRDNQIDYVLFVPGEMDALREDMGLTPLQTNITVGNQCNKARLPDDADMLTRLEKDDPPAFIHNIDLPFGGLRLYAVDQEKLAEATGG